MTHSDIYTKFMIEYDKADITSSYPSLTPYEVATILDKAYLALVAQKLMGNDPRRSSFENDVKVTEDLRPLVTTTQVSPRMSQMYTNEYVYKLPDNFLYYVQAAVQTYESSKSIVDFKSHEDAQKYKYTDTNYPWVKHPIAYVENNGINVIFDSDCINNSSNKQMYLTYIMKPNMFVDGKSYLFGTQQFQLSDSMAEELINLAIIMSTEIVESSRLTTKINTRPLES